jgi:hypothetical protein
MSSEMYHLTMAGTGYACVGSTFDYSISVKYNLIIAWSGGTNLNLYTRK